MDFFRQVTNPWSQEVLIGIAWDLLLAAALAGAAFIIVHALYVRYVAKKEEGMDETALAALAEGLPERVVRHTLVTRLSHWLLAASVLVLLVTAFVPILGLRFPWVTIHWIAGLVLAGYTVFHTAHASAKGGLGSMWVRAGEVRETVQRLRRSLGRPAPEPPRPGKWALENKAFHHLSAAAGVAVVLTGFLMMLRIPTPFWEANPYFLSDGAWGVVFVLHGVAAVGFVGLIMAHVYFAIRPDKRWITWSMILGWVSRRDYLLHHDPARWPVLRRPAVTEEPAPPVHATTEP